MFSPQSPLSSGETYDVQLPCGICGLCANICEICGPPKPGTLPPPEKYPYAITCKRLGPISAPNCCLCMDKWDTAIKKVLYPKLYAYLGVKPTPDTIPYPSTC